MIKLVEYIALTNNIDFSGSYRRKYSTQKMLQATLQDAIPTNGQYKQCDACQSRQRNLTKTHRARKKASAEADVPTGGKRTREDGPSPEEQPQTRTRSEVPSSNVENAAEIDESDDNDDGPFGQEAIQIVCEFVRCR